MATEPRAASRTSQTQWGVVVLLAVAVVGLSAALIVRSGSAPAAPRPVPADAATPTMPAGGERTPTFGGPADPATEDLVDRFMAAYNTDDGGRALASFWTEDSTLWSRDGQSPARLTASPGFWPNAFRVGPAAQVGGFGEGFPVLVAFRVTVWGTGSTWIQLWTPAGDEILRMWVI